MKRYVDGGCLKVIVAVVFSIACGCDMSGELARDGGGVDGARVDAARDSGSFVFRDANTGPGPEAGTDADVSVDVDGGGSPCEDRMVIVERVSHMSESFHEGSILLPRNRTMVELETVDEFRTNVSDPTTRVFLAYDWHAVALIEDGIEIDWAWSYHAYHIAEDYCSINQSHYAEGEIRGRFYRGRIVDTTGLVAGASADGEVPLAPLGGAGGSASDPGLAGSGWNMFDITDLRTSCGVVRDVLGYPRGSTYRFVVEARRWPTIMREAAIFLVREERCEGP